MSSKRDHIYYFDYLRIIAAISVIYMHVAALPLREEVNIQWQMMNVCTSFAFTAVPLFFMMSGYLLLSSPNTGDITLLLKKRIPRLIVPLIGWTIVAAIWLAFSGHNLNVETVTGQLVSALNTPVMIHFWYMYTIIALYLISPFLYGAIHSLNKKGHIYVLILIALVSLKTILQIVLPSAISVFVNIDFISKIEFFSGHLCTFILGYYLGSNKHKIPNWILICVAALTLGIIIAGTYHLTAKAGTYTQDFQNQNSGFEIILAACIFLFFKQNCNKPIKGLTPIINSTVSLSLSIYMMHNILLSMFYAIGVYPHTKIEVTLLTILILLICMLVLKTVATIKPICYIATGMSYQAACSSCNWIYTYQWIKHSLHKSSNS